MTEIIIVLAIGIVICIVIMAILLYNFMQLLSTLNKRLISIISDILGSIDLATPHIDSLINDNNQIGLEDVLDEEEPSGFNPHNYDPFKEGNE